MNPCFLEAKIHLFILDSNGKERDDRKNCLLKLLAAMPHFVLDSSLIKKTLFSIGRKRQMLNLVKSRMKTAIERHSLIAKKGTCYEAVLENANCRFIDCGLYEVYEDRAHCRFSSRTL